MCSAIFTFTVRKLEIEATTDTVNFWKSLKSRKTSRKAVAGAGIVFNGEVCRGREELVEQWGLYFKDLYVPSESPDFDSEWKQVVESTVNEPFGLLPADENTFAPAETIQKVKNTLPREKAGNDDHVVYEHFIYGMHAVAPVLANLYTYM